VEDACVVLVEDENVLITLRRDGFDYAGAGRSLVGMISLLEKMHHGGA
jgi:hypothetical protein